MNRDDLINLSRLRLREAKVLIKNKQFDGAYYLCGYSVECGLKACIAKQTNRYDFPDRKIANASYVHDLKILVKTAGLEVSLNTEMNNTQFQINWNVVKDWSEQSRYQIVGNAKQNAIDLYKAVTSRKHGIKKWISRHW